MKRRPAATVEGRKDEPLPRVLADHRRLAEPVAAAIEWLRCQDALPFPSWMGRPEYGLPESWFLYPGTNVRA